MMEDGYVMVGYSAFEGRAEDPHNAAQLGRELKAAVVLVYSRYNRTITGAVPVTVQDPAQVVTSQHSGMVYGSGGTAFYSGQSTTVVPGGSSVYNVPYSVDRFDQVATYWVRFRGTLILGTVTRDLNDLEIRQAETNHGATVTAVVKGTPARAADMLRGDIITGVNGQRIEDDAHLRRILAGLAGQEVRIDVLRNGAVRQLRCTLNQRRQ
jgi:serine protease Do